MRNTLDMTFYCRKCKVNRKGLAPIELAISMNGERRFINLPMTMSPDRFEKQVASKTTNDTKNLMDRPHVPGQSDSEQEGYFFNAAQ